jgi:hypothetical protein
MRSTQQPEYDRLRVHWADYVLCPFALYLAIWLPGWREVRVQRGGEEDTQRSDALTRFLASRRGVLYVMTAGSVLHALVSE